MASILAKHGNNLVHYEQGEAAKFIFGTCVTRPLVMLGCINATPFDHFFKPSDPLVFDIPRASLNWSDPSEKRLSADFIEQLIATMLGSKHIRFKCCSFCGFPPKTLLLRKCNVEGNGVATLHVVPGFEMWTRKVMQELV
eukprot:CAMPEP_0197843946 /NCGR_PEP_ID=MMETSP1438-20131217/918_1 /TAXON_ID=1461541 /ORGANISM="Pterosperma sp., Strain CCMP1384" /LENGTH=139 /DNA_ID=CAMNT_0043454427 /DNA_START=84 /DNA_END=499 /DNA_ORIENTATION=+